MYYKHPNSECAVLLKDKAQHKAAYRYLVLCIKALSIKTSWFMVVVAHHLSTINQCLHPTKINSFVNNN